MAIKNIKIGNQTFRVYDDNELSNAQITIQQNGVTKGSFTLNGSSTTINLSDSDTHYTTKLVATTSSGTTNSETTNGGTYLRLFDDTANRASLKIQGINGVDVASDNNGQITIKVNPQDLSIDDGELV
jgi:riboflavin synthase alpha subunit